LSSVVLSLILPVITVPIQWHSHLTFVEPFANTFSLQANQPDSIITGKSQLNPIQTYSGINAQLVLLYSFFLAYIIGLAYKVFGFARNLKTIHQFIKQNPKEKENNYWIIRLTNEMPAFSFFNYIFINDNYKNLANKDLQLIKNHEIVHVKQYHTLDILFFELVSIVFWFNPVMKYLRKSLQEVHEYIVDEKVAGNGEQKKAYAQLLLNLASEAKTFNLIASFTGEHIKRRILMVAKPKTLPRYKLLFIVLVPLTAIMLLSFSYIKSPNSQEKTSQQGKHHVTSRNRIGEITWVGNTVYSTDTLNKVLGLKKGDYFSFDDLSWRLSSGDISTLYYDHGYVFFKADFATNLKVNVDYDLTITIFEGAIARMGDITVEGNVTVPFNEINKNIQIKQGELFNKTKILNSVRAIAAMGKFVPEEIEPVPIPNEETRRIDLVFNVKEK
jgi:beta-lactamase regulating signal transducer with metallopeptidase domain